MRNNKNEVEYASFSEITDNLVSSPADWSIATLLDYIDRGYVGFPDFQRNYVWDKNKASKLIESFALDLPVPQIFLYKNEKNRYQVIDGQQRILSLYFFKAGKFPKKSVRASLKEMGSNKKFITEEEFENKEHFEKFTLKFPKDPYSGTDNVLDNKNYDDLEEEYAFGVSTIRIMVIHSTQNNSIDVNSEAIYEVYNRLNSGGVNLNDQEIRMSIGMSDFMRKLVRDINPMPEWRAVLGRSVPEPRFGDLEILLRMCAAGDSVLREEGRIEYQAPMNRFLNRYAESAKKFTETDIEERVGRLKQFINILNKSNKVYIRKESKNVSRPILEGLYGAFYKSGVEDLPPHVISQIINDDDFILNASDKTTAKNQYEGRIERALEIIKEIKEKSEV